MGDVDAKKHDKGLTLPTLRFAWFTGVAIILLFIFTMAVSPLLSCWVTAAAVWLFVACLLRGRTQRDWLLTGAALLVVTAMITVGWNIARQNEYGPVIFDQRGRDHLREIQLKLEYYAEDGGSYPVLFDDLYVEGYLRELPVNPYFDHEEGPDKKRVRNIELSADRCFGDFSYIPDLVMAEDGTLTATGYTLLLYGLSGKPYGDYRDCVQDGSPLEYIVLALTDEEWPE